MLKIFVKPARPGVLLRDPATGEVIPPEGLLLAPGAHHAFWLRRESDGDAIISAAKPAPLSGKAKGD